MENRAAPRGHPRRFTLHTTAMSRRRTRLVSADAPLLLGAAAAIALGASGALAQGPAAAAASAARPTSALEWLAGCWERRAGERVIEEQWMAPRAGTLLGVGRTTLGDSVVEHEFVRIYEAGDTLVYAAHPSGQAPAEFRAAPPRAGGVVTFENAAHDFPQRVIYRRAGPDSLVARVEGTRRGVVRGVDFRYRRVPCPAGARGVPPAAP